MSVANGKDPRDRDKESELPTGADIDPWVVRYLLGVVRDCEEAAKKDRTNSTILPRKHTAGVSAARLLLQRAGTIGAGSDADGRHGGASGFAVSADATKAVLADPELRRLKLEMEYRQIELAAKGGDEEEGPVPRKKAW